MIAGGYTDTIVGHSFVRAADGTITTFDPPNESSSWAYGINADGVIAGQYAGFHGYVRAADGTITKFDPKNSTKTFVLNINKGGAITGWYEGGSHGSYVRAADGTITTFDDPDGCAQCTNAFAINNGGQITGRYTASVQDIFHGFVRNP